MHFVILEESCSDYASGSCKDGWGQRLAYNCSCQLTVKWRDVKYLLAHHLLTFKTHQGTYKTFLFL